MVAAARGEAAWSPATAPDVAQLVEAQLNNDPRRGETEDHPLGRSTCARTTAIVADLRRQGLHADAVPEAGRRVLVQRNGNVAIDCTDEVHPDLACHRLAGGAHHRAGHRRRRPGRAGHRQPLAQQGAPSSKSTPGPGPDAPHLSGGRLARPVGKAIVDHLFPPGDDGRIPVVGIAGGGSTSRIARLVAWLLQPPAGLVGLACREGLFLGTRRVDERDATDGLAERLLLNRDVDAAVFENDAATILAIEGLVHDRCRIGVVTDLDPAAALERHDIRDADDCRACCARRWTWCCPTARRCSMPTMPASPSWRSAATAP